MWVEIVAPEKLLFCTYKCHKSAEVRHIMHKGWNDASNDFQYIVGTVVQVYSFYERKPLSLHFH